MKNFLLWVVVNALALLVAIWLLDGITLDVAGKEGWQKVLTLAVVAIIFGVINSIIGTVVKVLAIPFIIVSLGLAILVINAAMLMLTSKIADGLDIPFHVDDFWWTAVWGALIISVVAAVLTALTPKD